MATPWYEGVLAGFAGFTARWRPWFKLPFAVGMPTLIGHRTAMRRRNLYDCETAPPTPPAPNGVDPHAFRTADGSYNDLGRPWMGMALTRFGRNVPIAQTFGEAEPGIHDPNPRLVSTRLLARREFVPVPHLNVLVPAWLQFMVHDWLSHGPNDKHGPRHVVPIPPGDDWPDPGPITVLRTLPEPELPSDAGRPRTYSNVETHWWDGSQIYGSSRERQDHMRRDPATGRATPRGKLPLDARGRLPLDPDSKLPNQELAGVNGNWWVGLSLMHTLFAREHNAIVDRLLIDHPAADDEWLFGKARLANAALMAKIHTTEWTPALMNSPEGRLAMRANWWGLAGETFARGYGRAGEGEVISGIPGSAADHHAAPYAMTEEFAAVYRMHSLIPDAFAFRRHADDAPLLETDLTGVSGGNVPGLYGRMSFEDALYSLATSHPGALVLHNYPTHLRRIPKKAEAGVAVDLATVDILRDRERGVPRYCAFRGHLGMAVPTTFAELTSNPEWQRELEAVYGAVEKVDLLVGCHAEAAPPGFGFSDTAFRIFILMASRRLKSDRFFTDDFTPEVYTPAGFAWVRDNTMRTVVTRHCPALAESFGDVRNLFFPWRRAGG